MTGNGNNGTLIIGGEGYWDADVYEGACLGSCVDTVITSFPFYHVSTLENDMGDDWYLNIQPDGIYLDGTFGRGGHSRKILEQISLKGTLFSYDLDPEAKLESENIDHSNFYFVHDNYRNIHLNFSDNSIDGVLLDCGVSSPQLDNPARGFSFRENGPLDMRFNTGFGPSCAEIINIFDEKEISKILWDYGEEKESRRIARAIVERRSVKQFTGTKDLSELICSVKKEITKKHPATKSFQALRIAVNDEIESLRDCLVNIKTKII